MTKHYNLSVIRANILHVYRGMSFQGYSICTLLTKMLKTVYFRTAMIVKESVTYSKLDLN